MKEFTVHGVASASRVIFGSPAVVGMVAATWPVAVGSAGGGSTSLAAGWPVVSGYLQLPSPAALSLGLEVVGVLSLAADGLSSEPQPARVRAATARAEIK